MKRVLIIGSGGAGKSTLARRLGEKTGIEVIHLDRLYWKPGWVKTAKEEWARVVENELKKDSWIIDGNFGGTLEMRAQACDTIIFLDLPRYLCLYRVLKRWVTHIGRSRPDMAPGCNEKMDLEFFMWVYNYPSRSGPEKEMILERFAEEKQIIRLRSRGDVEEFINSF